MTLQQQKEDHLESAKFAECAEEKAYAMAMIEKIDKATERNETYVYLPCFLEYMGADV